MCYHPITLKNPGRTPANDNHLVTVPCNKCIKCIEKKRTEWAFRLHQESMDHPTAYFVTLTYDEHNLPYLNLETGEYPLTLVDNNSFEDDQLQAIVYKKDVQNFIKKVRRYTEVHVNKYDPAQLHKKYFGKKKPRDYKKIYKETHDPYRIRYYFTSEYGTKNTRRPHYHGIIWNLEPSIAHKLEIQKIWTKGNTHIRPLTGDSTAEYFYLTKYMFKQRNLDIFPMKPFTLMSTKPYIGSRYMETSKDYHLAKRNLITKFNGRDLYLPRIYRDKFPTKLKELSRQYIEQQTEKLEKDQEIKSENQGNHSPYMLRFMKQFEKERKARHEQQLFNQKFTLAK